MKKSVILVLVLVAVAAVLFSVVRGERDEWSTASSEALEEFLLGREASMRLYGEEAKKHFARAAELDADFVAAKVMMLQYTSYEEHKPLLEEIKTADLGRLKDHERFLVEYNVARLEGRQDDAGVTLNRFLAEHPKNVWGLQTKAGLAWGRFELDEAESYYLKLLEADPNWVTAQNNLGYIAMGKGDFAAAEDHFMTYQFIAPDQANPHDSRGELLTLIGRYDEAWEEFEAALEIHPGFCASYNHQLTLAAVAGFEGRFEGILEGAAQHCDENHNLNLNCGVKLWSDFQKGNYEDWSVEREDGCRKTIEVDPMLHRMHAFAGNTDLASEMESKLVAELAEFEELGFVSDKHPVHGIMAHMEGVRLLADDQTEAAIEKFKAADEYLFFTGHDPGLLKLWNYLNLSVALDVDGDHEAAEKARQKAFSVNSQLDGMYQHIRRDLADRLPAS